MRLWFESPIRRYVFAKNAVPDPDIVSANSARSRKRFRASRPCRPGRMNERRRAPSANCQGSHNRGRSSASMREKDCAANNRLCPDSAAHSCRNDWTIFRIREGAWPVGHGWRRFVAAWMPKNAILSAEGAGTMDIGLIQLPSVGTRQRGKSAVRSHCLLPVGGRTTPPRRRRPRGGWSWPLCSPSPSCTAFGHAGSAKPHAPKLRRADRSQTVRPLRTQQAIAECPALADFPA